MMGGMQLQALLTFTRPLRSDRVRRIGEEVSGLAGVHLQGVELGRAGRWVVLAADLVGTREQAHGWLLHLLVALEGDEEEAELLLLEIDGTAQPLQA